VIPSAQPYQTTGIEVQGAALQRPGRYSGCVRWVQFGRANVRVRRLPFTRTVEQVRAILDDVDGPAVVVFTFVSPELSEAMLGLGARRGLTVVDLLGPLMGIFEEALHAMPSRTPGAFRGQTEETFTMIEAIHFTRRHDDGQGLDSIGDSDLIILGVSRTGKTPTSIYLSCRRVKVSNIPIIKGVPFPKKIAHLPIKKVGFLIDMERLIQLRSERARHMSYAGVPHYSSKSAIFDELEYCDDIYSRIPLLQTIDVTNRSIEEISEWITRNVL